LADGTNPNFAGFEQLAQKAGKGGNGGKGGKGGGLDTGDNAPDTLGFGGKGGKGGIGADGGKGGKGGGLDTGDNAPDTLAPNQGTTLIKVTITNNGVTETKFLSPGQTLQVDPGSQVVVDAGGLVIPVTEDGNGNIVFTLNGDTYTLGGLGTQLAEQNPDGTPVSTFGLFDNTTGGITNVAIEDFLQEVETAAGGGGGAGGGTSNDGTVGFIDTDGDGVPDAQGTSGGGEALGSEAPGTGGGGTPPPTGGGPEDPEVVDDGTPPESTSTVEANSDFFNFNYAAGDQPIRGRAENFTANDTELGGSEITVQELPATGGTLVGPLGTFTLHGDGDFEYNVTDGGGVTGSDFVVDRLTYTAVGANGDTDTGDVVVVLSNKFDFDVEGVFGSDANDTLFAAGGTTDALIVSRSGNDTISLDELVTERVAILREDTGTDTINNFGLAFGFGASDIVDVKDLIDFGGGETSGDIALVVNGANTDVVDNTADGGGQVVATVTGFAPGAAPGQLAISADGEITINTL